MDALQALALRRYWVNTILAHTWTFRHSHHDITPTNNALAALCTTPTLPRRAGCERAGGCIPPLPAGETCANTAASQWRRHSRALSVACGGAEQIFGRATRALLCGSCFLFRALLRHFCLAFPSYMPPCCAPDIRRQLQWMACPAAHLYLLFSYGPV